MPKQESSDSNPHKQPDISQTQSASSRVSRKKGEVTPKKSSTRGKGKITPMEDDVSNQLSLQQQQDLKAKFVTLFTQWTQLWPQIQAELRSLDQNTQEVYNRYNQYIQNIFTKIPQINWQEFNTQLPNLTSLLANMQKYSLQIALNTLLQGYQEIFPYIRTLSIADRNSYITQKQQIETMLSNFSTVALEDINAQLPILRSALQQLQQDYQKVLRQQQLQLYINKATSINAPQLQPGILNRFIIPTAKPLKITPKQQAQAILAKLLELTKQSTSPITITCTENLELFNELTTLLASEQYQPLKTKVQLLTVELPATTTEAPLSTEDIVLSELLTIAKHWQANVTDSQVSHRQFISLALVNTQEDSVTANPNRIPSWQNTPLALVATQLLTAMQQGKYLNNEAALKKTFNKLLLAQQKKLVKNQKISSLTLEAMITSSSNLSAKVIKLIAKHQNITLAVVKKLILCKNINDDLLKLLAKNPKFKNDPTIQQIIQQARKIINKKTTSEELTKLTDPQSKLTPEIMQLIVQNSQTSTATLCALVKQPYITLELLKLIKTHPNAKEQQDLIALINERRQKPIINLTTMMPMSEHQPTISQNSQQTSIFSELQKSLLNQLTALQNDINRYKKDLPSNDTAYQYLQEIEREIDKLLRKVKQASSTKDLQQLARKFKITSQQYKRNIKILLPNPAPGEITATETQSTASSPSPGGKTATEPQNPGKPTEEIDVVNVTGPEQSSTPKPS